MKITEHAWCTDEATRLATRAIEFCLQPDPKRAMLDLRQAGGQRQASFETARTLRVSPKKPKVQPE
ncbi:hypothetical protein [Neorhodopirellula pilleata]|uniref:hypothetical protein n=1 Tax=Neorhodopirellula pilleata TaxID=2714738 RepID=UPI0011B5B07F|nr:hypothetical protein [Neorhodopirellula pilleata]